MSTVRANSILDSSGGSTAQINGMTPTAQSLQGFRNRIINGDMRIDQRNAGAAVTVNPAAGAPYILDRWQLETSIGAYSAQRSTNAPAGFTNSFQVTVTSTGTPGTSGYSNLYHWVEGFNWADMGYGTSSAVTATLSFWVRSSVTGNFTVSLVNESVNLNNNRQYNIAVANTWTYISLTFVAPTSGSGFNTGNGRGVGIRFDLGTGTNFQTSSQNTWVSNLSSVTGSVQLITNASATWQITGVQLEAGSVATPFERRDYGRELIMCQRYYQNIGGQTLTGFAETSSSIAVTVFFYQQMRAAPTCSIRSGTLSIRSPGGDYNATSPALANTTVGTNAIWTNISGFSGLTTNAVVTSRLTNTDVIAASAEL